MFTTMNLRYSLDICFTVFTLRLIPIGVVTADGDPDSDLAKLLHQMPELRISTEHHFPGG